MRVEVLPDHIEHGTPCHEEDCPIALAIIDALHGEPLLQDVYVSCETVVVVYTTGEEKIFALPWEVTEIIDEYDDTGVMYPFGFEL